jgi:hypothetical protein
MDQTGLGGGAGGSDRLKNLVVNYKKEKELINSHFENLKIRFSDLTSEVERERQENQVTLLSSLCSTLYVIFFLIMNIFSD